MDDMLILVLGNNLTVKQEYTVLYVFKKWCLFLFCCVIFIYFIAEINLYFLFWEC